MKTRSNFAVYDPRGRTMTVAEGDTIPIGWFVSIGGAAPAEVTGATVVVGRTIDRSGGDGDCEVLERHLSVQATAPAVAPVIATAAAPVVMPDAAKAAMAEITSAGGVASFHPAVVSPKASRCRQWSVEGVVGGYRVYYSAFSAGPHGWKSAAGRHHTMAECLALMPVHEIEQARIEQRSEANRKYIVGLGAAAPTDKSGYSSLDWQYEDAQNNRNW